MTTATRVYLDWAAATPLLPAAKAALLPWLEDSFGNPSAIHAEGQAARAAVEAARTHIARVLEVQSAQVTFTGSGTEGNNLAIMGVIAAHVAAGTAYEAMEVVTTDLEHPSVTRTLQTLQSRGVQVVTVPVKETGVIDIAVLQTLVTPRTVLLTTALVNSEIGTIQPSRTLAKVLRAQAPQAVLHLDAAQAPLWLRCQFAALGADVVTFDAGKCCGPKGVGWLVTKPTTLLQPVLFGGGQEQGLRPGTENVAGIVGAATAFGWAQEQWRERSETVRATAVAAATELLTALPFAFLNGAAVGSEDRVANNINISIPGFDTEYAAVVLDAAGFAVSTKSACSGAGGGQSAVVYATTHDRARATATLRLTLGPDTTLTQLQRLTKLLQAHCAQMESFRSVEPSN